MSAVVLIGVDVNAWQGVLASRWRLSDVTQHWRHSSSNM